MSGRSRRGSPSSDRSGARPGSLDRQKPMLTTLHDPTTSRISSVLDKLFSQAGNAVGATLRAIVCAPVAERRHQLRIGIPAMRAGSRHGPIAIFHCDDPHRVASRIPLSNSELCLSAPPRPADRRPPLSAPRPRAPAARQPIINKCALSSPLRGFYCPPRGKNLL